jgi:hypothetical protein
VITGATLALVMAGTAVVSANGGRDDHDERGFGHGRPGRGIMRDALGPGFPGFGGRLGGGLGFGIDGVVRSETTGDLGQAGFRTRRIAVGTVTSASDTELAYTLATGESATVGADEDTEVLAVSRDAEDGGDGPLRRRMVSLDEIALAEVPADADVIVWSEAGDEGTFVAQRVIVRPSADATAAADDGAADDGAADDAATSEASPDASPAV